MPNFKCKKLINLNFPRQSEGVEFLWKACNEKVELVLTRFENENFFIQIKQDEKGNWIIKGDKHSKPSKIGYLQKALLEFKKNFCDEILSEAVALKSTRLVEKSPLIASNLKELLSKLETKRQIYIEIGFGSGRHLLFQAKKNPEIFIVGIEIYTPALEQVAKLAKEQKLDNVLLIKSDARLLLSVLKSNFIDKIFLHFPVPWDKKPHRRVVGEKFAKECQRVLKQDGCFEVRTDSRLYFDFTLETFLNFTHLQAQIHKNKDLQISSKYEDRWKKQQKDIYDLIIKIKDESLQKQDLSDFGLEELQLNQNDLQKIKTQFKNETFAKENCFLHFENIYQKDEELVIKIAFGAFNQPEHCYLILNDSMAFLFDEPFKTEENLQALNLLKEKIKNYL
ncbi:tRNA (guanosine(46)-N7)-methyltransferase TrmB [Campylobacter sp. US33a]|uniref:tRNA (guanosine(46)-N7)-methyltransferase TrmB n=1 Tax=Campylobacter sp. US33a TaxID=2498120 RepID=UPI0010684C44|nr:tRNA (guanosine(46)-N7)-methyltransferase TrmB [Campylobacter sp. US33a]TEY03596.1 tRNA (guanosine(46)-N7)-methyltransferase TrmB [Campylobacter sp. US33a]